MSVPEYWIVDSVTNTLEVYTLGAGVFILAGEYAEGQVVDSPSLFALSFPAARIFAE
jgi:Uma2 family endonuclease